jgi:4-amino-4-deoxy-L-arabinose transferase-like glycosyltransferase
VSRHWFVLGITLAVAVYVALRLAVLWRFPPYYDEGWYGYTAWFAFGNPEARFMALRDNKGPLLTWLAFVPLGLDRDAVLTSVRIVAAVAGLVSLGAVGLIAHRLSGRGVAVAAMGLFALMPFVVVQTSMGIHEPLIMAAGTIALYLQIRLAEEPRVDIALLLGAALAAGLLTKASGLYALLLLPFSLLLFDWSAHARWRRLARWVGCIVLALVIVGMGQGLVRMSGDFYAGDAAAVAPMQFNSPSYALSHLGEVLAQNWPAYRAQLLGYLTVPLLLLGGVGLAVVFARRPRVALLLCAWLILPIAISTLIANKPLARYYLPAMPEVAILAAVGLVATAAWIVPRIDGRARIAIPVTLVAVVLLPAVAFAVRFAASPRTAELPGFDDRELIADASAGTGWPELGRELRRRTNGAPTVTVTAGIPTELLPSLASTGDGLAPVERLRTGDPREGEARFYIENGGPPPASGFRLIWSFERPRDGVPLRLYERAG